MASDGWPCKATSTMDGSTPLYSLNSYLSRESAVRYRRETGFEEPQSIVHACDGGGVGRTVWKSAANEGDRNLSRSFFVMAVVWQPCGASQVALCKLQTCIHISSTLFQYHVLRVVGTSW